MDSDPVRWLGIALVGCACAGCAPSPEPVSFTATPIAASDCKVYWAANEATQQCHKHEGLEPDSGEPVTIYTNEIDDTNLLGLAGIFIYRSSIPQRFDKEEYEQKMRKAYFADFHLVAAGPSQTTMASWGEEIHIQPVTHDAAPDLGCIWWFDDAIIEDKFTNAIRSLENKFGFIGARNVSAEEHLRLVEY
jgi:hypothetical protein